MVLHAQVCGRVGSCPIKHKPRPVQTVPGAFLMCAEHVRQLEGESPFDNLMEVKS